jgi:hypothetical protein
VKSEAENNMEAECRGLETVIWVFVAMRNFLGDSWLVAAALALASGGNNT